MKSKLIVILLLLAMVLISGCIGQEEVTDKERAKSACIDECNSRLDAGEDLSNGPCLLNPIPDALDWVCDVAHDPRQLIDNQPENQCSAYREGRAHHFVEVDPDCKFIQSR